jgi:hypothetical protein
MLGPQVDVMSAGERTTSGEDVSVGLTDGDGDVVGVSVGVGLVQGGELLGVGFGLCEW